MQSFSFKIWTRVAVSISYDDNHYNTGTSFYFYLYWNKDTTQCCLTSSFEKKYNKSKKLKEGET